MKLNLGKTSSNNGKFASTKMDVVNPPTDTELPLNDPPPRYPPTEISVWGKQIDGNRKAANKIVFTFNKIPLIFNTS